MDILNHPIKPEKGKTIAVAYITAGLKPAFSNVDFVLPVSFPITAEAKITAKTTLIIVISIFSFTFKFRFFLLTIILILNSE